jgi:mannose-6-phosphate isomerase-like protein (cupin superfamily)
MKIKKDNLVGFEDKRGILVFANKDILDFNYEYLTMGTMVPGAKRGGHYHKRIFEKLLCLTGTITLVLETDDSEEVIELLPGEITDIPTGVVHTLFNYGNDVVSFVEFKSENFNQEDHDTFRTD